MVSKSDSSNELRETLSSLMDGELLADGARVPCSRWRSDAQSRVDWHAYQLIGDVLRSDDLATSPARDEVFLQRLRGRLALEPVPMAPLPADRAMPERVEPVVINGASHAGLASAVPRRVGARRFAPMAVAAGVVVVAGVVGVMRAAGPLGPADVPLMATVAPTGGATGLVPVSSAGAGGAVSMTMVRDARLDRYIAAHRKLANGIAVPDHAGAPLSVVYESR